MELENGAPGRTFAAAGLADQAEGLALLDRKRHAIDGAYLTNLALEDPLVIGKWTCRFSTRNRSPV